MSSPTEPRPSEVGDLRVLMAHCRYQLRGGEDVVFENECAALRSRGHTVIEYVRTNEDVQGRASIGLARETVWSTQTYRELTQIIRNERPDIAHFHNTLPLISPSGYHACKDAGIPVVQTLHNYRTMCLNAMLFREGDICERCVGKRFALAGVRHGCYRDSRAASAAVATMTAFHWLKGTWAHAVDRYACLTRFSVEMHARAGLPRPKLHIKPNFLPHDPGFSRGPSEPRAVFLGRVSQEKGLEWLLEAWTSQRIDVPLAVVGDGPLRADLERRYASGRITFLGQLPREQCVAELARSSVLVVSSLCYEGFPITVLEASACGTPVLVPRQGGMAEVEAMGVGRTYRPQDPQHLAAQLGEICGATPEERADTRMQARAAFERCFSAEVGYRNLLKLYEAARTGGSQA